MATGYAQPGDAVLNFDADEDEDPDNPATSLLSVELGKPEPQKSDEPRPKPSRLNLKRMAAMAKPELPYLGVGLLCLLLGNAALLAIPFFAGQIVDVTTNPAFSEIGAIPISSSSTRIDSKEKLTSVLVTLCVVVTIAAIFSACRAYLFTVAGERVVTRLRNQLFSSIVIQDVSFFDSAKTGELINRLASDCTVLQNTVTVNVSMSVRGVFTFFSGFAMLFYISWKLTLIMMSFVPLLVVGAVVYGRFVKKLSTSFQDSLAAASDTANEAISNIRTVRSFSKEEYEMQRYHEKINGAFLVAKRRSAAFGYFTGGATFLGNLSVAIILWYGGNQVIDGDMSAGMLAAFIMYTIAVAAGLGTIANLYSDFMKAIGASERIFELIDRKPEVHWKGGVQPASLTGQFELDNVTFSYPSRPDVTVLDGVSLSLPPGSVVALVGRSGGGKTTIVGLLELFYYPTSGRITIDGHDLRTLDPQVLRRHVSIVSQEPVLFASTIADNIAYGRQGASRDEIVAVAKLANAHQFIAAFPDGYETVVGERGIRLSGGQKQRIAIARALLTDPKVLLLDEATSALDAESEYLVRQALETLIKGRTVLVIAHRLSTVKNADVVCVVDKGKIIEKGTHDQLLAIPNSVYGKLVKRQLQQ